MESVTIDRRRVDEGTSDADVVRAMRSGSDGACNEFVRRYRPILEAYARASAIPRWEWDTCITEVLNDEILRFSTRPLEPPLNLRAYLIKAVYHRFLNNRRSATSRDRHHASASVDITPGEWVVSSVCSESALRACDGPDGAHRTTSATLGRLAADLGRGLTEEERAILGWIAQGISHREIATWLGATYDATTKRIWRLCRRLRNDATRHAARYDAAERVEVERFLRRAG